MDLWIDLHAHFRALEFSDFFWKMKKMSKKVTFSLFPENSKMAPFWSKIVKNRPFWPKTPKNGGFLAFFSKTAHWNFLIFAGSLASAVQKILRLWFFGEIWKMALFGQYWPKFGHLAHWKRLAKKISVENVLFFFKNRKIYKYIWWQKCCQPFP